jgi:hypothetical protein
MTELFDFVLKLAGTGAALIAIAILWNLFRQTFMKNPHQPPLVFHWLPVIGSTVTYGIDPLKFFAQCQAKVRTLPRTYKLLSYIHACCNILMDDCSTAISLHSFSSARKLRSTSAPRGTTSFSTRSIRMRMRRTYMRF